MFRIKNYQMSPTIINLFKLQDSTYNMRDNNKFKIPLVNTNAKKFNITYYGPIFWNNLPIHIKSYNSQTTLNLFFQKLNIQYHVISVKIHIFYNIWVFIYICHIYY